MNEYEPHECDFCPGTVRPIDARGESVRVKDQIILVEGATIGKCDRCGHRYRPAEILKQVERVADDPKNASYMASVPVVRAA